MRTDSMAWSRMMKVGEFWIYLESIADRFADGLNARCERKRQGKGDTQEFWAEQLEGWNYHQLRYDIPGWEVE